MPPQRSRYSLDDAKAEVSTSRDRVSGFLNASNAGKSKRNGPNAMVGSILKDATKASHINADEPEPHDDLPKIDWASFDTSLLHAYRHAHCLEQPPAFTNSYNQRLLSRPGVGQMSPSMARPKDRRRIGKDQLAMSVRKDFNAAMLHEQETITSFMYAVQNQDKTFCMKFDTRAAK